MIKKIISYIVFITTLIFISGNLFAQNKKKLWLQVDDHVIVNAKSEKHQSVNNYKLVQLRYNDFIDEVKNAAKFNFNKEQSSVIISLPNEKGQLESFKVFEKSAFEPALQKKYPQIQSFIGVSLDNPSTTFRFSVSPQKKLNGLLFKNNQAFVIENYSKEDSVYIIYQKKANSKSENNFKCLVNEVTIQNKSTIQSKVSSADDGHRTYRLAMSATGEYTAYHGGTVASALAAMNTTITNVNAVFETDLNLTLQLVDNTTIIYTDATTDPYTSNFNTELQSTLSSVVGEANYDIGHLVHRVSSGSDGNSGCIGCVCVDGAKGSGFTSSTDPQGPYFDLDFVAHEMGHQFGANHTWTTNLDGTTANEGFNVQMEPGSGSTIMSYAGLTRTADIQTSVDSYFHAISIEQITANLKSKNCQLPTVNNNVPVVDAGLDYSIPKGTAFRLNGSATDVDSSDVLTYCWEQMDENNAATTIPSTTATTGVAFRSYSPVLETERVFPKYSDVLNGNLAPKWEVIPNVARILNFRLTARDNRAGGGTNSFDDMVVSVTNTGPFEVTSQNMSNIVWNNGTTETVTWNVNGANSLAGASNVDILLSTDGGVSFPTVLASNVPNDGSQTITVPNTPAPFCRIKIQPTDNIFFAINAIDFAIDYNVTTTCKTYTSTPNLTITDNSTEFDTDGLNVPDNFIISDVNVTVNINHTYLGDLLISILSPDGTRVDLFERQCSSNDNLTVTFDDEGSNLVCETTTAGTFTPSKPLSIINTKSSLGVWTLGVNDNGEFDTGTLNSWVIELCETATIPLDVAKLSLSNFSVYPNPSNGELNIKFKADNNDALISLFDVRGRLILEKEYTLKNQLFDKTLNIENISNGIYFLRVFSGNKVSSKKIIISN